MWGDEGPRECFCLYQMGCKGPATYQNCPNIRWNEGTNWPIGCGHPCIGCAEPNFWDRMTPFYRHLKGVPGFNAATSIDTIGAIGAGGVAAAFAAHGLIQIGKRRLAKRKEATVEQTPAPVAADEKKDGET
jgi:hydrogenase small subunit